MGIVERRKSSLSQLSLTPSSEGPVEIAGGTDGHQFVFSARDIIAGTKKVRTTHTMYFLKSTIGLLSDFGARWYAYSEQSSNQWLTVLDQFQ